MLECNAWMMVMLKRLALRLMVMNLLEIGQQFMTQVTVFLCSMNPAPCSWVSSRPPQYSRWPSCVLFSPAFSNRDSHSPRIFQIYLVNLCFSSSSFPVSFSVLAFQVPMMVLLLTRIFLLGTPVVQFTPLPWCLTEGAVLGNLGDDRAGMLSFLVVISCGESWAMSHGGAHSSPCQTTAKILQLGGLPWSRVLDWRSLQYGRWPHRGSSYNQQCSTSIAMWQAVPGYIIPTGKVPGLTWYPWYL